ncbi:hypothetical protein J2X77_002165 [Sphingobacterium sp. 2149]|uniref:Uncharacterized protein n=1 Tax=Sphingobacterium zeae TaxID=1776859 RepID=A0ABU0U3P0_9SPHI|nr:hypothetical protein [Sphingobacterium zeae]MDR6735297.1 hypothetical protein [Sphingobacterium sp. 2149]
MIWLRNSVFFKKNIIYWGKILSRGVTYIKQYELSIIKI